MQLSHLGQAEIRGPRNQNKPDTANLVRLKNGRSASIVMNEASKNSPPFVSKLSSLSSFVRCSAIHSFMHILLASIQPAAAEPPGAMSDSGGDPGPSATDIITYIGVPLAVLGVLLSCADTAITLAALSKIKRALRHSRLTALTRSDVVNRVIEIELPRYAVTPWDRFNHRAE